MKRVLLGFSGGIDSCASVDLLRASGYEITALTLDTMGDEQMIESARAAAAKMDVDLRVEDVRADFDRQIVDYFVDEYMCGRTPAPCTLCNPLIKWYTLYDVACREGFDHIATGHYFRISQHENRLYVSTAEDKLKDQSYYLWGLPQKVLKMALTPMGSMIKSEVRIQRAVAVTERESMGVCFLKGRSYGEFLEVHCPGVISRGEIVDRNGEVVGCHNGYQLYTIGQKKGVELPAGGCIIGVDWVRNRLLAGNDSDLYHTNLIVDKYTVVDMDEILTSDKIEVKIRGLGRNPDGYCSVNKVDEGLHITLSSPAWASAKGQPVVMYIGDRVVGGGFLERYF